MLNPHKLFKLLVFFIFFFYLLYGYYQELIFSLPGFAGYGWYLTLLQFGYYSLFGKVAPLNNLCCYVTLYVVDRDVFSSRREKSAFENLHTSCLDNSSNYGVLKCKFGLLKLSYPGTYTHHLKVDNIVFPGHLQMLQTYPSPDWGNIDPRQETWSIGLCGLWCHPTLRAHCARSFSGRAASGVIPLHTRTARAASGAPSRHSRSAPATA